MNSNPTPTPLPVQIPKRYAALLGIDPTFLYRANPGARRLGPDLVNALMKLAANDPELADIRREHLRPSCKDCEFCHAQEK